MEPFLPPLDLWAVSANSVAVVHALRTVLLLLYHNGVPDARPHPS